MIGTCIKFDRAKGIGFIVSKDDVTLPDIFVHFSCIQQNAVWRRKFLLPGMTIQFDVESEPDPNDPESERLRAKNVQVLAPITIAIQRGVQP